MCGLNAWMRASSWNWKPVIASRFCTIGGIRIVVLAISVVTRR